MSESEINWDTVGLGKEPDLHIARRIGVSDTTVGRQRRKRGIPRFDPLGNINWDRVGLGQRYDKDIALYLGVSDSTVSSMRKKLGIEQFSPPRKRKRPSRGPKYRRSISFDPQIYVRLDRHVALTGEPKAMFATRALSLLLDLEGSIPEPDLEEAKSAIEEMAPKRNTGNTASGIFTF